MKKYLFGLLVLALLVLPMSTLAAAPQEVVVHVRNQTGAPVELSLTNADGVKLFFTLTPGVNNITLLDGLYDFYAGTACGAQAGVWNLPVTTTYYIDCKGQQLNIYKDVECTDKGLYVYHEEIETFFIPYGPSPDWVDKASFIAVWDSRWYLNTGLVWGCYDGHTPLHPSGA